jgi:hypothetical protein
MSLAIRAWEDPTPEEWDRTWAGCAGATWFESRAWAQVWHEASEGAIAPAPKVAAFSDGRRALLPFSQRRIWLGLDRVHELCPAGTYGGWLSTAPLSGAHAELLARHLVRACANLTWRVSPFGSAALPPDVDAEPDTTQVVDLRAGFAAVEDGWRRGSKRAKEWSRGIARARSAGVQVEVAARNEDWREYYATYEESLQRWGPEASARYGWKLFDALSRRAPEEVRLWLARRGGEVVAGALCFYAASHVAYWHGASRTDALEHRPVNLLLAEAIAHACAAGHSWFDLNPSGGHRSVQRFKEGLATTVLPCPVVRTVRPLRRRMRGLVGARC